MTRMIRKGRAGGGGGGSPRMMQLAAIVAALLLFVFAGVYLTAMSAAFSDSSSSTNKSDEAVPVENQSLRARKENEDVATGATPPDGDESSLQKKSKQDNAAISAGASANAAAATATDKKETLVLTTTLGEMKIVLRPDLSPESIDYVRQVVAQDNCPNCRFYRAEKPGILQGILKAPDVALATQKGSCPQGYENVPNDCPAWDKSCGCHGPTMTRGMVGWAAGQTGPDFFVDAYAQPAKWWGTQHTVWGQIQDEATFAIIDTIWTLPTNQDGGLTFLNEPIKFLKIHLEKGAMDVATD